MDLEDKKENKLEHETERIEDVELLDDTAEISKLDLYTKS